MQQWKEPFYTIYISFTEPHKTLEILNTISKQAFERKDSHQNIAKEDNNVERIDPKVKYMYLVWRDNQIVYFNECLHAIFT